MLHKIFFVLAVQIILCHARTTIQEGKLQIKDVPVHPYVFEQQILNQLEKLREFLKNGNPEAGIPPLEPIYVDSFDYNFGLNDSYLDGAFNKLTISNVSDFKVTDIKFQLLPVRLTLTVYYDKLLFDGGYKLKGNLFEIPLDGSGKFRDEVTGLTVDLRFDITEKDRWVYLKVLGASFTVKEDQISFTNEQSGESIELPNEYTLELLDRIQTNYFPMLLNTLLIVLNDQLIGTTIDDIIHLITGSNIVEYLISQ